MHGLDDLSLQDRGPSYHRGGTFPVRLFFYSSHVTAVYPGTAYQNEVLF